MGSSAGTGVRSFAEGGSTSTPTGGFSGINPAAINVDSRAFGIGPAAQSLQQDLAREGARNQIQNQRQIYRPQYADYGLGSTPQAQGRLASILNMGNYGNQMPTFTRPQAAPQMSYRTPIPMSTDTKAVTDPNLAAINQAFAPPQSVYDPEGSYYFTAPNFMDSTQRNAILENPETYLGYAKYVQSGGDPSKFTRQAQPIQYMTQGQREALMKKQRLELSKLLPQARPDDNSYG
jgi:GH25 family lysozyme M1 (1,4-beta-N-acetylmuramidase)